MVCSSCGCCKTNQRTRVALSVSVSGGGFGVSGASAVAVLGATALEGRGWASDSAVGCKAPMGGFGGAVPA